MSAATKTRIDATDPVFLGQAEQQSSPSLKTSTTPNPPRSGTNTDHNVSQSNSGTHTLTYPSTSTQEDQPVSPPTVQVSLTYDVLSLITAAKFIGSPSAGANVFFTGTTRNTFNSRTVTRLEYTAYPALALRTMLSLCRKVLEKHALEKVYLVHRLGVVGVGEESIVIGVSSAHRKAAWQAGEELLELVKEKVEVWKREWFMDGGVVEGRDGTTGKDVAGQTDATVKERGEWRANADTNSSGAIIPK